MPAERFSGPRELYLFGKWDTGIEIITNTGFHAAANDKYVPEFAIESSSEDIASVWIDEFESGIDETGIKPGFIKMAFDKGAPECIQRGCNKEKLKCHNAQHASLVAGQ